jgi:hypothetical protein
MDMPRRSGFHGPVVELQDREAAALGWDAVPGTHHLNRQEACERLVDSRERSVITPIADNSDRQQQLGIPQALRKDVLDARETAVTFSADQASPLPPFFRRDFVGTKLKPVVGLPRFSQAGTLTHSLSISVLTDATDDSITGS